MSDTALNPKAAWAFPKPREEMEAEITRLREALKAVANRIDAMPVATRTASEQQILTFVQRALEGR